MNAENDATAGTPTGCRAYVSWKYRPDDVPMEPTEDRPFHLRYRSRCSGCGHDGPARSSENRAAEDACDHAYPGWRGMPVLEGRPYDDRRAEARWEREARAAYPAGWFDRGGPVLTYRGPAGGRHVPGYAPGGGYDMGRVTVRPAGRNTTASVEQQSLFG